MSDTIDHFVLERSPKGTVGDANSNGTLDTTDPGYVTLAASVAGGARAFDDPTTPTPDLFYRLTGHSAQGVVFPFNVVKGSNVVPGTVLWAKLFGSASFDAAYVAIAADGSIFVVGTFSGTADFGSGPKTSAGSQDVFVAKYDKAGLFKWVKTYGTASSQIAAISVAVGPDGNPVTLFALSGSANFGGGNRTSTSGSDGLILKLSGSDGAYQHDAQFIQSSTYGGIQQVLHMVVNPSNEVFVGGAFTGGTDFGGGTRTDGGGKAFLVKLSSALAYVWDAQKGYSSVRRIATDSSGFIYVTGRFSGTGTNDTIFLLKLSSLGATLATKQFGGLNVNANCWGLVVDGSSVVIGGVFLHDIDFGNGPLTDTGPCIYLARLATSDLGYLNAVTLTAHSIVGDRLINGLALDAGRNLYITGFLQGTQNFGNGVTLSALGYRDIFVAKYSSALACQWSRRFGKYGTGIWQQIGYGIAADAESVAVAGTSHAGDFGEVQLPDPSTNCPFLMRLKP